MSHTITDGDVAVETGRSIITIESKLRIQIRGGCVRIGGQAPENWDLGAR